MIFHYSFWTRPNDDLEHSAIRYALSFSMLRKQYPHVDIHLTTDNLGKKLLFDALEITYSSVVQTLESELKFAPRGLAQSLPKVFTYQSVREPFMHIDDDVFISKPFPDYLFKSELFAQSKEKLRYYQYAVQHLPNDLRQILCPEHGWQPFNLGICGGMDWEFWVSVADECIEVTKTLIDRNLFDSSLMMFNEQAVFGRRVAREHREVSYLLNDTLDDETAEPSGYTHLMNAKNYTETRLRVFEKLFTEDREMYERITEFFESSDPINPKENTYLKPL